MIQLNVEGWQKASSLKECCKCHVKTLAFIRSFHVSLFVCLFQVKKKWNCFSQSKKKMCFIACIWTRSLWMFRDLRLLNLVVSCVTARVYYISVDDILSTSQQLHFHTAHPKELTPWWTYTSPKAPQSLEELPPWHTDLLTSWDISSPPCPTSSFLTSDCSFKFRAARDHKAPPLHYSVLCFLSFIWRKMDNW